MADTVYQIEAIRGGVTSVILDLRGPQNTLETVNLLPNSAEQIEVSGIGGTQPLTLCEAREPRETRGGTVDN